MRIFERLRNLVADKAFCHETDKNLSKIMISSFTYLQRESGRFDQERRTEILAFASSAGCGLLTQQISSASVWCPAPFFMYFCTLVKKYSVFYGSHTVSTARCSRFFQRHYRKFHSCGIFCRVVDCVVPDVWKALRMSETSITTHPRTRQNITKDFRPFMVLGSVLT